jgi:DNA-directed RNA polymerase specialized sigma24 family protein
LAKEFELTTTGASIEALFDKITETEAKTAAIQDQLSAAMAERREIVMSLREAGVSYGAIAKRLGLTRSGVQSILRS